MAALTHEMVQDQSPEHERNLALWPWFADDERTVPWVALAALTALALALRLIALNQQLWLDEMVMVVNIVRHPLAEIVTSFDTQNQHMLYSILARGAVMVFGESAWSIRLPAVVFGALSVPALYLCARLWVSRRESLLACLLLAVSYHHLWFSQNARGYTMMAFATLLATYFLVRGMRECAARWWAGYAVAMALGLYTHLTMGFVLAGHVLVWAWLAASRRRVLGRWPAHVGWAPGGFVLAGVLALALYAPVLPDAYRTTLGAGGSAARVKAEWNNPLWTLASTARGLAAGAGGKLSTVALPAGVVVLLAGLVSYWRRNPLVVALMLLPGMLLAAAMLLLGRNLWPRFFFFAVGFALLILVRGAMAAGEWAARRTGRVAAAGAWGTVVVLLMAAASAASLPSAYIYPKQDFQGAMRFVDSARAPGEPVVATGLAGLPLTRYYARDWTWARTQQELDAARVPGRAMWLVYASPIYVKSRQLQIWETLGSEFEIVRVFRGTVDEGEIYVAKSVAK